MPSCDSPYQPREDSTLLEKHVRALAFGSVLDMGTGSGIQAITAALNPNVKSVIGLDIQEEAIDYCRKNIRNPKLIFAVSDLFTLFKNKKLKNTKFDTILFNPPYLPQELIERDLSLEGGKNGYETIERFLDGVNSYLKEEGIILLLFSSLSKKEKIDSFIGCNLLEFELLEKQTYFFEQLYIYKIQKSALLKKLESQGISNLHYFAKGKRGFIYTGRWNGMKVAIKIKNPKSQVDSVQKEIEFIKKVNKRKIGPRLLFSGDGFFSYEFVEGIEIVDFLVRERRKEILVALSDIFDQLHILDSMHLDKQEMSHPQKHILIDRKNKPTLIDFERAKFVEKGSNVSQFCDFLLTANVSSILLSKKININKEQFIQLAREYKKNQNKEKFNQIIDYLNNAN